MLLARLRLLANPQQGQAWRLSPFIWHRQIETWQQVKEAQVVDWADGGLEEWRLPHVPHCFGSDACSTEFGLRRCGPPFSFTGLEQVLGGPVAVYALYLRVGDQCVAEPDYSIICYALKQLGVPVLVVPSHWFWPSVCVCELVSVSTSNILVCHRSEWAASRPQSVQANNLLACSLKMPIYLRPLPAWGPQKREVLIFCLLVFCTSHQSQASKCSQIFSGCIHLVAVGKIGSSLECTVDRLANKSSTRHQAIQLVDCDRKMDSLM
ncbi:unnamed protein product [Protopolystoma xenopodis]|uniref:Uncharacterized protein n=1 Tax=Protopolystoma xenopodis TaxID=117903 RepID=A0A448WF97_9PLAT|nr:unnamed protein product [Protopolystoma xenopodis]